MKCIICMLICLLWAGPVSAQTSISVDIAKARFAWSWVQGAGGPVTAFRMKCGPSAGTYPTLVSIPDPDARSLMLSAIVTEPGKYFCAVSAANQFGESANSNEVTFDAGVGPVAPADLQIQAQ